MSGKRTHPAEITSARLLLHYEKWFDRFSGKELLSFGDVRAALKRIADEDENPESMYDEVSDE